MSDNINPMLLNPTSSTPDRVPGQTQFDKMVQPFPLEYVDTPHYYHCTVPNHHMCRTDGKKLAFVFGICKTADKYDIRYFDEEIDKGNPYIKKATPAQIDEFGMRTDPQGTMREKLTPEIEERVTAELQAKLRTELADKLKGLGFKISTAQEVELLASMMPAEEKKTPAQEAIDRLRTQFTGPLQGVVGSDKLGGAAAGSGS